MRKYIKYEIRGNYKFILSIITILLIASTIIQYNIYKSGNRSYYDSTNTTGFAALTLIIAVLTIFGASLAVFFHIVGSFKKELYEDRGYLTFTLPLSGNKILGSKILVSIIWYVAIGLSIILYNFLLAIALHGTKWIKAITSIIKKFEQNTVSAIIFSSIIVTILSILFTLVLVYLSIALSKVSVRNKKIGGLWFGIFLVLNGFLSFLTLKISELLPYYISLNDFKIIHFYGIHPFTSISNVIGQLFIYGTNYNGYINVFGSLAQLIFIILGFLTTGYLIEKKIDL